VLTTLVCSGVVLLLLASLLISQVGAGLVDAKARSSVSEHQAGLALVQQEVDQSLASSQDPEATREALKRAADELTVRGAAGDLYRVLLDGTAPSTFAYSSPAVRLGDVPPDLVAALDEGGTAYAFAEVPTAEGRGPGVVVGGVVAAGPALGEYRLYHLFPLTAEAETLGLVRRTATVAGLLLVLLLVLIAALVTRQVVSPVRQAAVVAERFASGRLEERMPVEGEDELARLGSTFNDMAEAIQRQIRLLEDLSRVQRRFVSDVSHELRTPLTTVRMAADVLHEARHGLPEGAARSAELLQLELDRFERLLVDLLEISRYDAGAASTAFEPVDLAALVHRVAGQVRPLADASGVVLDLSGVPTERTVVELDAVRVERVVRNLLVNAVEHGEGRPVVVRLAGDDTAVAVVVRDHGIGLRPGESNLVFTRFWRADPSRARTTGGTGLGLAISFEDVRLHGGWLHAWGEPGRGAAFRMTLPRRAGAVLTTSPLPLEPSASDRQVTA
jgi:two-component system, OmpR family, sensor histidine kinase MtrB